MQHWKSITDDPVAPEVHALVAESLSGLRADAVETYDEALRAAVRGRRVLDVGAVEHDLGHAAAPSWKHRRIVEYAGEVVGIDILDEQVIALARGGFDIRRVDATSSVDMGERFDVVVVGDVIEHVDDPVALLAFAGRHLEQDGTVLVKTPNPYWWRHVLRVFSEGTFVANADHVRWITPSMALELSHRAGLRLTRYRIVGTSRKVATLRRLTARIGDATELLGHDLLYEFQKPAPAT